MPASVVWFLVKKFWWVLPLVGALWYGYSWIHDRGAASRDPEVAKLNGDVEVLRGVVEAHRQTVANQQAVFKKALEEANTGNAAALAKAKESLDKSAARAKVLEAKLKKVSDYVSPTADAACILNRGFVQLHNQAANPDTATGTPAVSTGGPKDADAPSGVALSTVAATVRDNYAEANARGEVIKAWQDWYTNTLEVWKKAVQTQLNFLTVPPPPH